VLLRLRTVDDVFVHVASWHGIGHTRNVLDRLRVLGGELRLHEAAVLCSDVRGLQWPPTFSVTANFVGGRNFATDEIKQAVGQRIASAHGWGYTDDDATAGLNVRVFIEHSTAHVGVRLADHPLHRRSYKQWHVPGSLKPPVAAAMVWLAGIQPGVALLDPFCGAGTVPIEAAAYGMRALGGDLDASALLAAQANARAADAYAGLSVWDARALPLASGSAERIVTNLPWGREVAVDGTLETLYRDACAELRRVVTPAGRIVLLTSAPDLVHLPGHWASECIEISVFGQRPTLLAFSPLD
jgi:23S rRNA G2445 N2-methylase RlmL